MSETLKLQVMVAEPSQKSCAALQEILEQVGRDVGAGAAIGGINWSGEGKIIGTYIIVKHDDPHPRCDRCGRGVQNMEQLRYGHCIDCLAQPGVLEQATAARPMD